MKEDMGIMFRALHENYDLALQYRFTWNMLQKSGQFRYTIWKNFTYFIDWMDKKVSKKQLYEIMNKSYELEDNILCPIQMTGGKEGDRNEEIKFKTWLMANIFRYVENPKKEENPLQKYIGKVKFTKIYQKAEYEDKEDEKWTPPEKDKNGNDAEDRKSVVDIQMVVYIDDEMKVPRRYELEHGWKDEWIKEGTNEISNEYEKDFEDFRKKWAALRKNARIPSWYLFDPKNPKVIADDHNMMQKWDKQMFDFLKEQKWMERIPSSDQYEEKSEFIVNCSQLLGIGGEGMVIRKPTIKRIGPVPKSYENRKFDALKIIPISELNFKDAKNVSKMDEFVTKISKKETNDENKG